MRATPVAAAVVAALGAALALTVGATSAAGRASAGEVVVPRGQPVQIAVVLDRTTDVGTPFTPGIRNAIKLAVWLHPAIRGFRVQLNDFDGQCGAADGVIAQNAATAAAVVSNPQNVAVIGHMCSQPFAATPCPPASASALSIYEGAGIVTVNGSTTDPCLPTVGPTVFNGTAVPDPQFDNWYGVVKTLPSDRLWRQIYELVFGVAPTDFADLYFDATNLLLTRLGQVSTVSGGQLSIDRSALANAVRATTGFPGVTCSVSLDADGYRIDDTMSLARCGGT